MNPPDSQPRPSAFRPERTGFGISHNVSGVTLITSREKLWKCWRPVAGALKERSQRFPKHPPREGSLRLGDLNTSTATENLKQTNLVLSDIRIQVEDDTDIDPPTELSGCRKKTEGFQWNDPQATVEIWLVHSLR